MTPDRVRTREGALEELLRLRQEVSESLDDEVAGQLFSNELVAAVFREAWRTQFDEDRRDFRARLRQIIVDVIETARLQSETQSETP